MKCNCGGKLVKIRSGTYQCVKCDQYSAVAFDEIPVTYLAPDTNTIVSRELEAKLTNQIANALYVPRRYLNR
jgi:hypothetical protein